MIEIPKILLVEDDRHIALALRIRLSAADYTVLLAANVAEALAIAADQLPEVAVLDVNLPDGNGLDLMQHLRQLASCESIATIIMTASRKQDLRELALEQGAVAFLEKPFSSDALLDSIAGCIGKRKASKGS